jgi:hypothetical protein
MLRRGENILWMFLYMISNDRIEKKIELYGYFWKSIIVGFFF